MKKKVLSEIDLHYGEIPSPRGKADILGFEIDRTQIKYDILFSSAFNKCIKEKDYIRSKDYKIPSTKATTVLQAYLRDHFIVPNKKFLSPMLEWGNVYAPLELSLNRNHVDRMLLRNAPDYTCIYGVDVAKDSCELIIDYDDNTKVGNTWHMPLKTNNYIIFPSTQRYHISKNISTQHNFFFCSNYSYMRTG